MSQSIVVTTKFARGQKVFYRLRLPAKFYDVPCPMCAGSKIVNITRTLPCGGKTDLEIGCPECRSEYSKISTGSKSVKKPARFVVRQGTIGKITVEFYDRKRDPFGFIDEPNEMEETPWGFKKVSYMLTETGVGGGNIYRESGLFLTVEEARTRDAGQGMHEVRDGEGEENPSNLAVVEMAKE